MTWKLQTISGEFTGTEITIERDMWVGRHQDADIVLAAAEISRRHAAFLLKDQALYVQDLKSSNGTFVNDLRVEHEILLKDGDIVQFASLKFSVLAPAGSGSISAAQDATAQSLPSKPNSEQAVLTQQPLAAAKDQVIEPTVIQQPAEAVATSEPIRPADPVEPVVEKAPAEKMNEQGIPALKERDANVQLSPEGMLKTVGIPKPAPLPEGIDLTAAPAKHEACEVNIPVTCQNEEAETQKNASIGLMALIAIIFVAIIAWFIFN